MEKNSRLGFKLSRDFNGNRSYSKVPLTVSRLEFPMHNDSKLGMLAGVVGVVVAAVLLSRNPPAIPNVPAPVVQSAQPAPGLANAASVARVPAASTPVARGRPEIEGKTASRSTNEDDE